MGEAKTIAQAQEDFRPIFLQEGLKSAQTLVHAINVEKGWHDQNPRVEEFMEWFRSNYPDEVSISGEEAIRAKVEALFGPRTFGDDVALLHSEVSEMLEEFRVHGMDRLYEESVGGQGAGARRARVLDGAPYPSWGKPIGVPSEAADVLVRLLDTCERYGINLAAEFIAKVSYNATRPHRHGGKAL